MAKEDNKKFYFTPIRSEDRLIALKDLALKKETLTLWKKGDEKKSDQFEIIELNESTGTFTLQRKESSFLERIATQDAPFAMGDELVLFKSPLKRFQYFSSGRIRFDEPKKLYFLKVDHDMYRAEQRQDFRLDANEFNTIQFVVEERIYRAVDASAGGTCIGIMSQEKGLFIKDTLFPNCHLSINGKRFKIAEAKVVKVWEADIMNNEKRMVKGYKVGLQFSGMNEKEREDLCRHVIGEARKEDEERRTRNEQQ